MIGRLLRLVVGFFLLAGSALFGRPPGSKPVAPVARRKTPWTRWALRAGLLLLAVAVGGFLVTASGIISIKASSRHWAVTHWFLNFAKERSVATHSIGLKPPHLAVDWRIMKGAGHFEMGCRPCHGSPDLAPPRIPFAMTPNPPPLAEKARDYTPAELFYIIKHGIKFTGMPGWPARNRDDEVWAVVAFLQKLPELDAPSYRHLVHGEAPGNHDAPIQALVPPKEISALVTQNCARCHDADGNGRGTGGFPKLAGQSVDYLHASLAAYAAGERHSGIMEPIAAALPPSTLRALAEYYHRLAPSPDSGETAAFDRGKAIATYGIPEKQVPACAECHIPGVAPRNPNYPRLAGQYKEYLILQLELFQSRSRGGTSYAHIMHHAADGLSPQDIIDVATFFAALDPNK